MIDAMIVVAIVSCVFSAGTVFGVVLSMRRRMWDED